MLDGLKIVFQSKITVILIFIFNSKKSLWLGIRYAVNKDIIFFCINIGQFLNDLYLFKLSYIYLTAQYHLH